MKKCRLSLRYLLGRNQSYTDGNVRVTDKLEFLTHSLRNNEKNDVTNAVLKFVLRIRLTLRIRERFNVVFRT
jgi:hypothetical protein